MSDSSTPVTPHTAQLHGLLERMRAGDPAAHDELLRGVGNQLERLAHNMLRRFPAVRRWAETGDVLQNALLRLLRALGEVRPGSMRQFYGLAAEQLRRELLDLARHFRGPQGVGANHASDGGAALASVPAGAPDSGDLDRWRIFHEEVARLPDEEREVVGLIFYDGRPQAEAAELLAVSVRTVQRRWQSALLTLHRRLAEPGA